MDDTPENEIESLFEAPPMGEQERMIEAILFATAAPMTSKQLAERMPHGCEVPEALARLRKRYEGRGVHLVKAGDGWAFRTAPDLGFLMQKETVETRKLSQAAIETLAIIAHRQPVTRAEIEEIRGVSVGNGVLQALQGYGWIRVRGHKEVPGRPALWGTTEQLLQDLGLESVEQLQTQIERFIQQVMHEQQEESL